MKIDPPMWTGADLECMNVTVGNGNCRQCLPAEGGNNIFPDNLSVNKPVEVGYNTVENP